MPSLPPGEEPGHPRAKGFRSFYRNLKSLARGSSKVPTAVLGSSGVLGFRGLEIRSFTAWDSESLSKLHRSERFRV